MRKRIVILLAALFSLLLFAGTAVAQVKVIKGKDRVIYKKKTVIDFEDAMVEGQLAKPEGSYMVTRGRTKFKSLITLRTNFNDQIRKHARTL